MIDSAVILAVSSATHSSQLTANRPGAMLPALGKPMVVRVMDRLYRAGIRHYTVIVGINEGAVASYLNKQWMPDAKVEFVLRSNESMAMVIARVAQKLNKPFLITNYNTFTNERFIEALISEHNANPYHMIITGAHQSLSPESDSYFGLVDKKQITRITNSRPESGQQHFILANLAIFGHHASAHLKELDEKRTADYERNLLQIAGKYAETPEAQIMVAQTAWILRVEGDIDLLRLNRRLLEDSNDSHILSELPYSAKIIPPVRIDPQVSVGQSVIIGPHVYIERGSSIGYGAKISNAIILERSNVPADSKVNDCIVTSRGTITI